MAAPEHVWFCLRFRVRSAKFERMQAKATAEINEGMSQWPFFKSP
jgi:hypothetical protein